VTVEEVALMESSWEPVVFNGSGLIRPAYGDVLDLRDVTVPPGAAIVAQDLRVSAHLELIGGSALRASNHIDILNNSVDIVIVAQGKALPVLGLGFIGEAYTKVPRTISLTISDEGFEKKEIGAFTHVIISGETLSNCEEWLNMVELSDRKHFQVLCVSGSGAKTLAEVRALVVKGIDQGDDPSSDLVVYVAVAVAAVVVIGVIVFVLLRKKKKHGKKRRKEGKGSKSYSYSYSYSYSKSG
jgi:hypothetical protein